MSQYTEDQRTLILLARHYLDVGQPKKALDTTDRMMASRMQDPDCWLIRGQALHDLKRYAAASQVARQGLTLAPEYAPLLYLLCECEDELGNLQTAEQAILTALRIHPEEPQFLCRYALLVAEAGQLDKANQLVSAAARLEPDHPAISHTRATLAYVRGNDKEFGIHGREILEYDPESSHGHYVTGISEQISGRHSKAYRHLKTAVQMDPENTYYTDGARHGRLMSHWLLWPLWPLYRLGSAKAWLVATGIVFTLCSLRLFKLSRYFVMVYIGLCIYSWVVPPLLKKRLQRRY